MPVEKIVLNASPLILLCNGGLAYVLPELFSDIIVPDGVWREIVDGPHLDQTAQTLPGLDWVKREIVEPAPLVIPWDLGLGETEVLSFAV